MNLYLTVSSFLNCTGSAVLAVSLIMAGRRNARNVLAAFFFFTISVWSGFYLGWRLAPDAVWALFFCRLLMAAAVFIPPVLLHFVTRLTGERRPVVVSMGYMVAGVLAAAEQPGWIVAGIRLDETYGFWPEAGPLFSVALMYFAVITLLALWQVARYCRGPDTPSVRQLRYIFVALVVGFVGGATNFPLWYGVPVPPIGNGLVLVYTAMMAHAILKYRVAEVSIDLGKGVVYSGLVLTLAVFYVVASATGAYFLRSPYSYFDLLRQFFTSLCVTGLFLWLAPRLRMETERLMEQTLFKGRYRHRSQLRDLAARLFSFDDEDRVFTESATVIARALRIDHAAIYFHAELQSGFVRRAAVGFDRADAIPATLDDDHPLVALLVREQTTFVYRRAELRSVPLSETIEKLRSQFCFETLVPILGHQSLLGFVLLGSGRSGLVDDLDLSLVETIAVQIGLAVRSRQLERRANQTENLISLGTLAAGLAHELRNPLVSIKTFTGLLREHGSDAEFQQGFLQVMERDVNRIGAIVESVAAFAQNQQVAFSSVDLRQVLRSVADISAEERRKAAPKLAWPDQDAATVYGNFGQLVQVFLNLVQNATDALEGCPNPQISVAWRTEESGTGRWLRVEVEDNGRGIDPQILPRIFDPFVTTKATGRGQGTRRGMGLGLAIVKRIIDGHRGQIGVDSQLEKGTRFTVLLPAPDLPT